MDRSKSRTDLLAAGRKRLQQFRQKKDKDKDSKGGSSRGKSSKKSSKRGEHESDADAATSTSISTASSQVSDGKETDIDSDFGSTEISGSQSLENLIMPDSNAPSDNLSSVAITSDTDVVKTEFSSNTSVALQIQGIGENDSESLIQNEEDICQDVDAEVAKAESPRTSNSLGSEGGATHEPMSAPVDMLTPPAPVDAAAGKAVRVEREDEDREESLLLSEDIPKPSLMQTREDQEADGLDMKKSSQSHDTETAGQKNLPFSEVGEDNQPLVGIAIALEKTRIMDASHRMEQSGEAAEVSSSVEETMQDRLSASALASDQEDDIATAGPVMRNQERETGPRTSHEETPLQSSYQESNKGVCSVEDSELQEGLNEQHAPGGSVFADKSHELSRGLIEDASCRVEQTGKAAEVSSSVEEIMQDRLSASALASDQEDDIANAGHVMRNQERETVPPTSHEEMSLQSSYEESNKGVYSVEDSELQEGLNEQHTPGGSVFADKSHELSRGLIEDASCRVEQTGKAAEVSSSVEEIMQDRLSASALASDQEDDIANAGHVMRNQERETVPPTSHEEMSLQSSYEESNKGVYSVEDSELQEGLNEQHAPGGSVFADKSHELSRGLIEDASCRVEQTGEAAEVSSPVEEIMQDRLSASALDSDQEDNIATAGFVMRNQERETVPPTSHEEMSLQSSYEESNKGVYSVEDSELQEGLNEQHTPGGSVFADKSHQLSRGLIKDASLGMEQTGEAAEVSSSVEEIMQDRFSGSALTSDQEDDIATAGPVMRSQERETVPHTSLEETLLQSSYEENSRGVYSGENRELQEGLNEQHAPGGSVFLDKSHELSMGTHEVNKSGPLDVSPIADLSSLSLLQLTEVVRGLSEEDYHFLLKSRTAVSNADPLACSSILPDHGFPEMFERLKEELFLSNFMKDVLSLQLAEQLELQLESDNHRYQLIDELSEVRVLHNEVSEKNQGLAEELVNCRVELHDVAGKSEELQKQFYTAKVEVEALSARVLELQNCFEMSQKESSGLSTELADCRGLVTALQVENKDMNEALAVMIEEKNNLMEEKEFHLSESNKLSTELADIKNSVEGLTAENVNLSGRLSLVTEERNKIEAEIENLSHEIDRLSKELVESKDLVASLRVENIHLNGSLALSADQSKKLEEDKQSVVLENERQSSQIITLQEQLSVEQGEQMRFEAEIENLSQEIDRLSKELVESKDLVVSLQVENSNLNESLALSTDQRKKLEEDKQSVFLENERLSSQIIALRELLSVEQGERTRFEFDLKEATMHLEQLTKENVFLNSAVDVHKAKLEEISSRHSQVLSQQGDLGNQAQDAEEQNEDHEIAITEASLHISQDQDEEGQPGGLPLNLHEQEVFDDSLGFVSLKMGLDEVEKILEKLEKSIDGLHSQSVSFARSGGKVATPAVSKLIQAFESKVNQDEQEEERRDSNEVQSPSDPFMLTKEQIVNLRALFTKWGLDVQNVGALFKRERDGRKLCDAKYSELMDQFEALKQHCSNLEVSNIELSVQCEATKQLLADIQEKKSVLEEVCEALKQEDIRCKARNNAHYEKLGNCQSKIIELRMELYDVHQSSNEMASVIGDQLEKFQKEVMERAMLFEHGWNNTIAEIVEALGKLDGSIGETSSSTISTSAHDGLDINHRVAVSVNAATEVIVDLRKSLEASYSDHEAVCSSIKEVKEKCDDLLGKNELAVGTLHKIHGDLRKLVLSHWGSLSVEKVDLQSEALPDLLNYSSYQTIMKYVEDILNEKLELESITKELKSELIHREKELEELHIKSLGLDAVSKLIEDVETVLKGEDTNIEMNKEPVACLESLVSILVQKIRGANMQLHMAKEDYGYKVRELTELQERMHHLDTLRVENENEIRILKESLRQAEEALLAARSELHEKTSDLAQSEQRVSSIREKLGIAVTKGKGLIVQRDGLKQSLAETSSELERCLQELQLKDSRLHEVETKLKAYAEAGERVEALESELSYIRNSANALRESFLLKDSVLQRIEEILEDLDLPEQFHSRDIIEKIDWLARSAAGNSLPMNDWDQKSSAGGGSYSDAGFVVMDSWKDDGQLQSDSGEDFRKKFEELQSKFYGLAEQNEMLEQSLMERNSLVQRWEELIDRIDLPSHLRSMETEDRIEWLGRALIEANHHRDSLQLKIEKYDSYCGLLNADLEESQRRVSALQADLRAVAAEREHLSERVEVLMYECEKLSVQTRQTELQNEKLNNEITSLGEKLEQKVAVEEQILSIEYKIRKLQDLVVDALQESKTENRLSDRESIDSFEELLRRLIENYATLSSMKSAHGDALDGNHTHKDDATLDEARSIVILDKEEPVMGSLKKDLEEALHELMHVKLERDRNLEKQISLSGEVETLSKRTEELQVLLNQEEQKSASVREKLVVAVRKGKLLVQQRDSLKQTIEEMNNEMERLKSEINNREHTIAEYTQKFRDFSTYPDRLEALESERSLLENRLAETEHYVQEREYTLKMILNKLEEIEIGGEGNTGDPVKKLEWVGKLCSDLHFTVASLEQESRKSKSASELLLVELNEVQERNDAFQEELAKVAGELVDLRKERDSAEAAKLEALSHLEKLSTMHMERRKDQFSEIMALKSSIIQLRLGFIEFGKLLANALFMDLEYFRNLEAGLESCMKANKAANVVDTSVTRGHNSLLPGLPDNKSSSVSVDSWSDFDAIDHFDDNAIIENCRLLAHKLQEFLMEVGSFNKSIDKHSSLAQEQDQAISKLVMSIQREMASQRESFEVMKKEIGEKDGELVALRGNIAYLHDACANSAMVIENGKAELVGNDVASVDLGFSDQIQLISEEHVKTVADGLLLAAKEFASIKTEFLDANQKEMKATITNLQRELQEKDVQRDRICMELVNQIKDAEAAANTYSQDLQSSRMRELNLEKQVEQIEAERKILEQRLNELEDRQVTVAELEEKIRSQKDLLAAKDQEIEALMHALDEEEMQMEELTQNIEELKKAVQQKNLDIENLEASRSKVTKKLSITVSKFDELHHLSASLLTEVEKLQSQLQERDAEVSFLRQEVTRCTNDVLLASQMNSRSSDEIFEFLMWVDTIISREGMHDMHSDVKSNSQVYEYKEILHQKLMSVLSELEDLRAGAESKEALLQVERSKVNELTHKAESLAMSLREKELRLNLLEGVEESGRGTSTGSEILEVEPVVNKWTATGTSITPQVRSLRKGNNDHVAIAVDMDPGSTSRIEDEDDDKVHGFKSLSSSRVVPRFTRRLTDMIDGLWVSCDRALMRQPALRLGIIIYWAIMHALLAFVVV